MPKYKNTKKFIEPVRIGAQRYLVNPNEVLHSDVELDLNIYTFLVKVDDSELATAKPKPVPIKEKTVNANEIVQIKETIKKSDEELLKEISELKEAMSKFKTAADIDNELKALKREILEKTPEVEHSEIDDINNRVKALADMYRQLKDNEAFSNKLTELDENVALCLKRLEIMRSAVEVIDQVLHKLEKEIYQEGYNEIIVIEEDPK